MKLDDDNNSFKIKKTRTSWEELAQFQKSIKSINRKLLMMKKVAMQIIHNVLVLFM